MMIRAIVFCAVLGAGSLGFYTGWQMGDMECGLRSVKAKSEFNQQRATAWTDGFNNGVQCGLIAYTYAPEEDPARNDVPIMTLRARYWYIALQSVKPFLPQVEQMERKKAVIDRWEENRK